MSVNKVILVGRLGRDPEVRFTPSGQSVANMSLATDSTYKDRAGERQKRTEWHRIVMWGKLAEIAQKYLKKGSLIYVEGRIQQREYQDRDQNKRTSFDIVCNEMRMLGGRGDGAPAGGGGGGTAGEEAETHAPAAPAEEFGHSGEVSDEDIPF
jgi:single-strand DNA-binding protein